MRGWIAMMLALSACSFEHGVVGGAHDGGPGGDDATDAEVDGSTVDANPLCYGKSPDFSVCLASQPTQSILITGNIDTNGSATCDQGGVVMVVGTVKACVLAYTNVTFGTGNIGVNGDKPLVLIASGTLTVGAPTYLDLSSIRGSLGPGSNPSDCSTTGGGGVNASGGGGGAGGSFGTAGYPGASGGGTNGGAAAGAVGAPYNKLRGGCNGGDGGPGDNNAGAGGPGGGAVLLIARSTLRVDGTIDASGGGGAGGLASKGGAGGGGSGGMIALHGGPLMIGGTAAIFANGGGGGGGAGNGTDGAAGGNPASISVAAPGGLSVGGGTTAGGTGATRTSPAGMPNPTASGTGGGGGGGGLGVIRLLTPPGAVNNANFSPAPS